MRLKWTVLSSTLLLTLACTGLQAADALANRISWGEFSTKITPRHTIRMLLPDGTRIEGRPLAVKTDALDLRVTRTSNEVTQKKGNASISRASVSVVEVRKPRYLGRLIGTLVPIAVGGIVAAMGANHGDDIYRYLVTGAVIGATAPGGFFIGRAIDRRFETWTIVPDGQTPRP